MELLIASGVLALGHALASNGKEPRTCLQEQSPLPMPRPSNVYPPQAQQIAPDQSALFAKRFQDSLDPGRTGVVAPGRFYGQPVTAYASTRARSSQASDSLKDRKLEAFTGSPDPCNTQACSKVAQTPLWAPLPTTNLTTGPPSREAEMERYRGTMTKMNNVSPTPVVRVGPGLNAPPNVQAQGALHPFFRITPPLQNVERINRGASLPPVPGRGPTQRTAPAPIAHNRQRLPVEARPLLPSSSAIRGAARAGGEHTSIKRDVIEPDAYVGGASAPRTARPGQMHDRVPIDRPGFAVLGGAGGPQRGALPMEQRPDSRISLQLQDGGTISGPKQAWNPQGCARPTDRIDYIRAPAGPGLAANRSVALRNQEAKVTGRDVWTPPVGAFRNAAPAGQAPQQAENVRGRGTFTPALGAAGSAHHQGPVPQAVTQAEPRPEVVGYVPAGSAHLGNDQFGETTSHSTIPRERTDPVLNPGVDNSTARAPLGQITNQRPALTPQGTDFGIAQYALRGNPYLFDA